MRTPKLKAQSESRQPLRTVIGEFHSGHFRERAVRLRGVTDEFRGMPINLIQESAIWRHPVVGWSAGDGCVESSGGAVSRNLWARWILRDLEPFAIDSVAADVAVTEIRRKHELVIRRNTEPAKLRRQPWA